MVPDSLRTTCLRMKEFIWIMSIEQSLVNFYVVLVKVGGLKWPKIRELVLNLKFYSKRLIVLRIKPFYAHLLFSTSKKKRLTLSLASPYCIESHRTIKFKTKTPSLHKIKWWCEGSHLTGIYHWIRTKELGTGNRTGLRVRNEAMPWQSYISLP